MELGTKVLTATSFRITAQATVIPTKTVKENWIKPEKASWKCDGVPMLQAMPALRTALIKYQVRSLIGVPYFSEGWWVVQTCNYLFDMNDKKFRFRADFEDRETKSLKWRTSECAVLSRATPDVSHGVTQ